MKHTFPLTLSAFVFLLFLFPAIFFMFPPDTHVFSGVHTWMNALDSFFQLEVVHQGTANASWLAENVYSTDTPSVQRFLIFYTLMGKLSHWLGIDWLLFYQLNRAFWAGLFVVVLYWFIGLFVPQSKQKNFILALSLFSGGLGLALWPEGNLFLSLYNPPHMAFSLVLILVVMGNYYQWFNTKTQSHKKSTCFFCSQPFSPGRHPSLRCSFFVN